MKKIILQQAHDELSDAVGYYEGEQSGLGLRMLDDVDKHVRWILQHPEAPRLRKGGYRRVNLKVFPYHIAYIVREETLWILAVAHSNRKPEYWILRKKDIPSRSVDW